MSFDGAPLVVAILDAAPLAASFGFESADEELVPGVSLVTGFGFLNAGSPVAMHCKRCEFRFFGKLQLNES